MNEMHLKLACAELGVTVDQVLSWKEYPEDDIIALVVDYGIAGGKKYQLSLSSLTEEHGEPTPPEEIITTTNERKPADDFDTLENADLRALAKELGVKNYWNMRRDTLIKKVKNAYRS